MVLSQTSLILTFNCDSSEWTALLERLLPRQIALTRAKRDWELEIISRFRLMVKLETMETMKYSFFFFQML